MAIGPALYANDGEGVESVAPAVVHPDRRLKNLAWAKVRSWSMIGPARRLVGTPAAEPAIA